MIDRRTFGKAIGMGAAAVPLSGVLATPAASAAPTRAT
ncbi:MAG: hypothetical protein QOH84_1760, partial [Kribbellaceae bacterium]|nr:hypothetical protein [Kribbellaceae bacterium]